MSAIVSKRDAILSMCGVNPTPRVQEFEALRMAAINELLSRHNIPPLDSFSIAPIAIPIRSLFAVNDEKKRRTMMMALQGESATVESLTEIDEIDLRRLLKGCPFMPGEFAHWRGVQWIRLLIAMLQAEESFEGYEILQTTLL